MSEPPREKPRPRLAITIWIGATAAYTVVEALFSGHGIFSAEGMGVRGSSSSIGVGLRQAFEDGNILALAAAPFTPGGFFLIFLGALAIFSAGRLLERTAGPGVALLALAVGAPSGALAGHLGGDSISLGPTLAYMALLGGVIALAIRGRFSTPMLWSISFPLLALGALFESFADVPGGFHDLVELGANPLIGAGVAPQRLGLGRDSLQGPTDLAQDRLGDLLRPRCSSAPRGSSR